MADYHIRRSDDRWITRKDGVTVGIHRTQQQAIEAGKKRAKNDRCSVSWEDRDGALQGKTDYSPKRVRRNG